MFGEFNAPLISTGPFDWKLTYASWLNVKVNTDGAQERQ